MQGQEMSPGGARVPLAGQDPILRSGSSSSSDKALTGKSMNVLRTTGTSAVAGELLLLVSDDGLRVEMLLVLVKSLAWPVTLRFTRGGVVLLASSAPVEAPPTTVEKRDAIIAIEW
jgi:hypothetical protein